MRRPRPEAIPIQPAGPDERPLGRWNFLLPLFHGTYGATPELFIRVPGRVNLIGEHVDYNGLPVLPMALRREVAMVLRPRRDSRIRLANAGPDYDPLDLRIRSSAPTGPAGDWGNYVVAPARHLSELHGTLAGFDAVMDSDVPAAAGLASSAALVVAVGIALDAVNGLGHGRIELAEHLAEAERLVGTRGGGMDQAAALCARPRHALKIEFLPLRVSHRRVPEGWRFMVAHSLVKAEKSAGALHAYNRRVRECAEALQQLRPVLDDGQGVGYRELLARHEPDELMEMARAVLDDTLFARFRHVVTEGRRVQQGQAALLADDRKRFGALMRASHRSLREDFEVSCAELDRLVELARSAGADGARLTGAGFGGCVVILAEEDHAADIVSALEEGYYAGRDGLPPRGSRLFGVDPAEGASVLAL